MENYFPLMIIANMLAYNSNGRSMVFQKIYFMKWHQVHPPIKEMTLVEMLPSFAFKK